MNTKTKQIMAIVILGLALLSVGVFGLLQFGSVNGIGEKYLETKLISDNISNDTSEKEINTNDHDDNQITSSNDKSSNVEDKSAKVDRLEKTDLTKGEKGVNDNAEVSITSKPETRTVIKITETTPQQQLNYDKNSVLQEGEYLKCLKDEHILQWSAGDNEWDCVRPGESVFGKVVATKKHGVRETSTGVVYCDEENNLLVWENDSWRCKPYQSGGGANTDEQTLSFDIGTNNLTISNGNSVDLSSLAIDSDTLRDLHCNDNEIAKWNNTTNQWECAVDAEGVGSTTFLALTDTPNNYTGVSNYLTRVNSAGTGLEFVDGDGLYHKQGGNSYGATSILGTNDNYNLSFETNNVTRAYFTTNGHFLPNIDDTYALGDSTHRWRHLYVGPNSLHIGNNGDEGVISYNNNKLTFDKGLRIGSSGTDYILPDTRGMDGQVLKIDGSGNLTWQDDNGGSDSDWTISGNNQYSAVSGNVGIGANNPNAKVTINNIDTSQNALNISQTFTEIINDTTFITETIGGNNRDEVNYMNATGTGYIMAGNTYSYGSGNSDGYIVKINKNGSLDTSFGNGTGTITIGDGENEEINCIKVGGGGYILAGATNSYSINGDYDAYIVKLTSDGSLDTTFNSTGTLTIGGAGEEKAEYIKSVSGNKYVVVGYTYDDINGNKKMYIVRLTSSGHLDTTFGAGGVVTVGSNDFGFFATASSFIETDTGGYVITGRYEDQNGMTSGIYVVKLTSNGSLDTTFNTTGIVTLDDEGNGTADGRTHIIKSNDGKYVLIANTQIQEWVNDRSVITIVKLNENGSLDTSFAGGDGYAILDTRARATYIGQDSSNRYFVTGTLGVTDSQPDVEKIYTARLTSGGFLDSSYGSGGVRVFGDNNHVKYAANIGFGSYDSSWSQDGYVIAGYTNYQGAGDTDMFIMKIDMNGSLDGGCSSPIAYTGGGYLNYNIFNYMGNNGVSSIGDNDTNSGGVLNSGGTLTQQCTATTNTTTTSSHLVFNVNKNGNVGINNNTPSYNLDVIGTGRFTDILTIGDYTLPNTDGSANQVLQTDGSGNISWATVAGGGADSDWTVNGNDMYAGVSGNVGIGTTTPDYKLQVDGDIVPETDNVYDLGKTNLRWRHLYVGPNSLHIGNNGDEGVISYNNNKLTFDQGINIGTTSDTTAGNLRWTGTDFEGYDGTQWKSLTVSGGGADSDWTVNGNDMYAGVSGNVGIGTNSPLAPFHVLAGDGPNQQLDVMTLQAYSWGTGAESRLNFLMWGGGSNGAGYGAGIAGVDIGNYDFRLDFRARDNTTTNLNPTTVADTKMVVMPSGNIGIGTTSPAQILQVGENGDGTSAVANAWNTFSDRRWKTNINALENSLDKITALRGVSYNWKNNPDGKTQIGFIAQELQDIFPEFVSEDSNGYLSVNYGQLVAPIAMAIQEQQNQIEEQGIKIESNTLKTDVNIQTLAQLQTSVDDNLTIINQTLVTMQTSQEEINSQQELKNGEQDEAIASNTQSLTTLSENVNSLVNLTTDIIKTIGDHEARITALEEMIGQDTSNNNQDTNNNQGNNNQDTNGQDTNGEDTNNQDTNDGQDPNNPQTPNLTNLSEALESFSTNLALAEEGTICSEEDESCTPTQPVFTLSGDLIVERLKAKKIEVEEIEVAGVTTTNSLKINTVITDDGQESSSAGSATILAGERQITINTKALKKDSSIMITPTGNISGVDYYIEKDIDNSKFNIIISEASGHDISFDWFMVETSGNIQNN